MSGNLTPASSINDARTNAHLALGARLANIDLTQILVYVISHVIADALPFLAWQFDMLSPWWALLAGTDQERDLIEGAIGLHAQQGTPASIQTVLAALGFPQADIQEGQNAWGGDQYPSDQGWAVFRVLISRDGQEITAAVQQQAVDAVLFMKPLRCWLDSLQFVDAFEDFIPISDSFTAPGVDNPITITDTFTAPIQGITDVKAGKVLYNGHYYHTGWTYNGVAPAIADSGITINGTPVE
jgi:P2-related tail formation protein